MKITIPSYACVYSIFYAYNTAGVRDPNIYCCWFLAGSSSQVDIPALFHEESYGKGNNVCHVKPTSIPMRVSMGSSNNLLAHGLYWLGSDPPYLLDFFQAGDKTYAIRLYIHKTRSYTRVYVEQESWSPYGSPSPKYGECYYTYLSARLDFMPGYPGGYRSSTSYGRGSTKLDADLLVAESALAYTKYFGTTSRLDYQPSYEQTKGFHDMLLMLWYPTHRLTYTTGSNRYKVSVTLPSASSLSTSLLFDEDNLLLGSGYSVKPYAAYHLKALRQEAYLDALDKIPQLNDNSVSNVLEIVGFLKSIIIDHRVEIPNSLQSAWLAYRYSYNTSKSDLEEAVNFVYRNVDKEFLVKGFSCYGRVDSVYSGTPITVKCRIDVKQKELSQVDEIFQALYRYGLTPSFYVIWDMIPYSFIVDWFIPVGDILSGYDKTRMYARGYDITDLWYSISYDNVDDTGIPCHAYTRWGDETPPEFNGYYSIENMGSTSNKVLGFRILDAMSLFFK